MCKCIVTSKNKRKYIVKFERYDRECFNVALYRSMLFVKIPIMFTVIKDVVNLRGLDFELEADKLVEDYEKQYIKGEI